MIGLHHMVLYRLENCYSKSASRTVYVGTILKDYPRMIENVMNRLEKVSELTRGVF